MSDTGAPKRWVSTGEPQLFGVELAKPWRRGDNLLARIESALGRDDSGDARFVVCCADARDSLGDELLALPSRLDGVRICVSLSASTLESLERETLDRLRVGLLLEGVTLASSLRSLCIPGLEAVRFDDSFLTSAASDVRVGCALAALSSLAVDLGLVTLGSYPGDGALRERDRGRLPDYVPAASAALDLRRMPESALRH